MTERLFRDRIAFVTADRNQSCFICEAVASKDDEKSKVIDRTILSIILLNAFPYNSGHLLVAPARHVGDLTELRTDERNELIELTSRCLEVLREELGAHGFNIGANLGESAGAGLPGHFHMHVVPRWPGDTNFMPVIGEAKVMPEILDETFKRLRGRFVT